MKELALYSYLIIWGMKHKVVSIIHRKLLTLQLLIPINWQDHKHTVTLKYH